MKNTFDAYIVGLGGQGVLTIGDILAHAAHNKGLHVNFYPTKGMSQRGGFVQGQLRLGREEAGASLPPMGADLVIAMERSEALKGVRFAKAGTDFLLFDSVWPTNALLMGKAGYPSIEEVAGDVQAAGARLFRLDEAGLPQLDGAPVRANMFILGAALKNTALGEWFTYEDIAAAIEAFFAKGLNVNLLAVRAGYEAAVGAY